MRIAMNRIVLAILALFAGLAAQVAPAEARLCGKVEVGSTLGLKCSARVTAVAAAAAFRPQPPRQVEAIAPAGTGLPLQIQEVPTVRVGIDRARQ